MLRRLAAPGRTPHSFPAYNALRPLQLLKYRLVTTMATPDEEAHWLHHTSKKGLAFSLYTKPIQKSPQDDRDYRLIRLDNGLQAMLVQDIKADKSAASLDVAVGHLDDPVRTH